MRLLNNNCFSVWEQESLPPNIFLREHDFLQGQAGRLNFTGVSRQSNRSCCQSNRLFRPFTEVLEYSRMAPMALLGNRMFCSNVLPTPCSFHSGFLTASGNGRGFQADNQREAAKMGGSLNRPISAHATQGHLKKKGSNAYVQRRDVNTFMLYTVRSNPLRVQSLVILLPGARAHVDLTPLTSRSSGDRGL